MLPAQTVGLELEDGLEDTLVKETLQQPGALPLLQYTLSELYKRSKDKRTLTWDDYRDIGGVGKSVALFAEKTLKDLKKLGVQRERIVRKIFHDLIKIEDEDKYVSRRAMFADILSRIGDEENTQDVIRTLVNANILVSDRDSNTLKEELRISHEALIKEWDSLQKWLDEDKENIRVQQELDEAAKRWDNNNKKDEYLTYSRGRLTQIEEIVANNTITLGSLQQEFVKACKDKIERELEEKKDIEERRKKAEEEKQQAEEEKRQAEEEKRQAEEEKRQAQK